MTVIAAAVQAARETGLILRLGLSAYHTTAPVNQGGCVIMGLNFVVWRLFDSTVHLSQII